MTDLTVSNWLSFFKDAGIPSGLGATYAVIFCDHRIQKELLGDLNREILIEMGIKAMGDVIAILKHAKAIAKQISRESTSKLLTTSPPAKTKSKTGDASSPSSGEHPKENNSKEADKSVFSRLGSEDDGSTNSGVFKRLGEPVKTPGGDKPSSIVKVAQKKKSDEILESSSKLVSTRRLSATSKRKNVLDRLGPEADNSVTKVLHSIKSNAQANGGRTTILQGVSNASTRKHKLSEDSDTSSSSSITKNDEKVVNKPKIIRLVPGAKMPSKSVASTKSKLILRKGITPNSEKKSSHVLNRLGNKVSFTECPTLKTSTNSKVLMAMRKPLAMDSELSGSRPNLQLRKKAVGDFSSSSSETKQRPKIKRVLAMDAEASQAENRFNYAGLQSSKKIPTLKRRLAMDSEADASSKTKVQSLKKIVKSSPRPSAGVSRLLADGKMLLKNPISRRINLGARRNLPSRSINRNFESSTASAGIFKGQNPKNGSVFQRLGS